MSKPRNCPVCRILLRHVDLGEGIAVDLCSTCRGIWFDQHELESACKRQDKHEIFSSASAGPGNPIRCAVCGGWNPRSQSKCVKCDAELLFECTTCNLPMEQAKVGEITIDRCRSCKGVWLDGGELSLLFEHYKKLKSQKPAAGSSIDGSDVWMATLDTFIWAPHLTYYAGVFIADAALHLPGALAGGAKAALEHVGDLPELAGKMADGAAGLAGSAVDLSGTLLSGAADMASHVPELAGNVAEGMSTFFEAILDLISGVFD